MSEQIFISYRRDGGDIYAKAICDALKVRGYTVFYDFDSLHGGYFDDRIYNAIEGCNDFVLVLPPNSLDRCVNEDDWVRLEIKHALNCGKNIIPVMLPGFSFPKQLPHDIANISRINGIPFIMQFFDRAVIPEIIDRLSTESVSSVQQTNVPRPRPAHKESEGLEFSFDKDENSYSVEKIGSCADAHIVIPDSYRGKSVTRISPFAFYYNPFRIWYPETNSVFIPDSVTSIGDNAFAFLDSLTSINIPNRVTYIGNSTFVGCRSLTSINIPNSVTYIGESAFLGCQSLTSITIPVSVKSIGHRAFDNCSSIQTVSYSGSVKQWTNIKLGAFCLPESIAEIHCSDGFYRILPQLEFSHNDDQSGYILRQGLRSEKHISIPMFYNGNLVTEIGDFAFCNCKSLDSIRIPDSITSIGTEAFCGCQSLSSINIPNSVTEIGVSAFNDCQSMTSINISNSVTHIERYTFNRCRSLASIIIPSNVQSIDEYAFDNCDNLQTVQFDGTVEQWNDVYLGINCFPKHIDVIHCINGEFSLESDEYE